MKLHLGVIDIPYADAKGPTTGGVAQILEKKYGVMRAFARVKEQVIVDELTLSVQKALETVMMGGPKSATPYARATGKIEDSFKKFLSSREVESVGIPGVPTQAALDGVNTRKKKGKNKKGKLRRPSFIDTTLYQSSFKVWTE